MVLDRQARKENPNFSNKTFGCHYCELTPGGI